jgi:hypothetical protein
MIVFLYFYLLRNNKDLFIRTLSVTRYKINVEKVCGTFRTSPRPEKVADTF